MSPSPAADPFGPPSGSQRRSLLPVAAAWGVSGTIAGTAVGATLHLIDRVPGVAPIALGAGALAALSGAGLWFVARRHEQGLPTSRGGSLRRGAPWLFAVPLGAGVLALTALAFVGTVHTGSRAVGMGFLLLAVAASGLAVPLAASWALGRALRADLAGDSQAAERIWERVAGWAFLPSRARVEAALNLGSLALRRGDLEQAARWYAVPERGRGAAFGAAGRALVRVLQGRYQEAEALLVRAAGGGRAATTEADGVRLLLVLRRDGPGEALDLAERLAGGPTGPLFAGVRAFARRDAGVHEPLEPGLREALEASSLPGIIPELQDL